MLLQRSQRVLETIPIGSLGLIPLKSCEELGREVYCIVKVKNKLPNHKANLVDDYQVIKTMCENNRKETIIENWIKDKIKDTYIMISPEWRNCDFKYDFWIKQ